jgi:ribosomal protein S1
VPSTGDYTFHSLRPGFLVHVKISTIYENGIQVSFLGGVNGTIFQDHLDKEPSKYKVGEKLVARFIAVDPLTKKISLSILPHIIKMKPTKEDMQSKDI